MNGKISETALKNLKKEEPMLWLNPNVSAAEDLKFKTHLSMKDMLDAEARLKRFSPLILEYFPETEETGGLIESDLVRLPAFERHLSETSGLRGRLLLKKDSHLKIAGSIKARGGIYEVLYIAEKLAMENGLITDGDSYAKLAGDSCRKLFSKYTIHVSSTGNLGLSIGIISRTLGFNVVVHMSLDAKQWKKDMLREKGATVIEYSGDFSAAVIEGREKAALDARSIFVDDENSESLFLGYSVAALRLVEQLKKKVIEVSEESPLFVYIPCGVGGAPGGITFGLKQVFGRDVHVFFVEPTKSPSMLLGLATGLHDEISVQDIGLSGRTLADGLAVGRPSKFVGKVIDNLISGIFTVEDEELFKYLRILDSEEGIRIEPSACAAFEGPSRIFEYESGLCYIRENVKCEPEKINHIAWATGGALVPAKIMEEYLNA